MSDEFPLYVEYELPTDASSLELSVSDRISGTNTSVNDRLFGNVNTDSAPDIESVPDAAGVYIVFEDGEVVLGAIAVEGEGIVYSHSEFNVESYKKIIEDE